MARFWDRWDRWDKTGANFSAYTWKRWTLKASFILAKFSLVSAYRDFCRRSSSKGMAELWRVRANECRTKSDVAPQSTAQNCKYEEAADRLLLGSSYNIRANSRI